MKDISERRIEFETDRGANRKLVRDAFDVGRQAFNGASFASLFTLSRVDLPLLFNHLGGCMLILVTRVTLKADV